MKVSRLRRAVSAVLSALIISIILPLTAESESWYEDVASNDQYHDAIWYMTTASYASGYPDNTFKPENLVTRAEALKMILASSKTEITDGSGLTFSDVVDSDWFHSYLETALSIGIISGYEDGTFKPNETVNRVEALKMLLQAREVTLTEGSEWYDKYLNFAIEHALVVPSNTGDYLPSNPVSRGELSEMIYRLYKDNYSGSIEYGGATWYGGLFEGSGTASGDIYDSDQLTAAHKTLPFGTIVKTTNLSNGLSVMVKINDRGPYRDGYIIDLSSSAFEKIANLSTGVLNVRVEVLK